ncbi:endolytic transglycosylase MltG [Gracilibacillus oryzae]|uniref:Endolytic murein transglycosylase n=1 Tax=Gracilibacillus oryzae TaxID=1672701 RepID=A0A7C8KQI4_9BACI|nr:endolytic transglycosylase MltG [Gracilibacillus oryzae]KAB8127302.1 endolytic transglycosylase MltG [Gracilibacillus oryzae]
MSKSTDDSNKKERKKPTYKEIAQERGREASIARKIFFFIFIILIAFIVIGGYSAYKYVANGLAPVEPDTEEQVQVTIPMGSSTTDIATILEDAGLINNSLIYRFYVKFNNAADFQAGDYTLSPSMTLAEITSQLETGTVHKEAVLRVTVPEGRNIEEIATIYEENAGINREEFLEKMNDQAYIQELMETYPNILTEEILQEDIRYPLEGYLFPATYEFYEEEPTIDTIVTNMLNKSRDILFIYMDQIDSLEQFTIHDIVTFASLVEEEAPSMEDRKRIAGVFYNRMAQDMMLQTDPTVIYAHGEHISRLTYEDYEIQSPYNTYTVMGLPVGPIANYGESSLQAVLEPEDSNYLYFLADAEGNVHYSETYEQHQAYEQQYIHSQD